MSDVVLPSELNTDLLKFAPDLVKGKKGNKSVPVSYGPNNAELLLQTPTMVSPFNLKPFVDEGTGKAVWSLDLAFRNMDGNPQLAAFYSNLQKIDEAVAGQVLTHSEAWLGKAMPKMLLDDLHFPLVKPSRKAKQGDTVYPPSLKIKMPPPPGPDDKPDIKIWGNDRQPKDFEHVCGGSTVKAIFAIKSIWFMNKNFGLTTRCVRTV